MFHPMIPQYSILQLGKSCQELKSDYSWKLKTLEIYCVVFN